MPQPLDGQGKPFITLAQFLKVRELVGTGGDAKARVREGASLVNGEPERRPGRKLHSGDTVSFEGETYRVDLEALKPAQR